MSCNCGTSSGSCKRSYMRIDDVIFDKKYVSKLVFYKEYFSIFFKGDCKEFKFPLLAPKTPNQIAEYQLELNSCDDQVDMSTDDHSKLINLDLEGQHPIASVIELQNVLDSKTNINSIVDNCITDNSQVPLSATQGKVLDGKISDLTTQMSLKASQDSLDAVITVLNEKPSSVDVQNALNNKQDIIEGILYNNLPNASEYPNKIYFCADRNCLAFSNGNQWLKINLESF